MSTLPIESHTKRKADEGEDPVTANKRHKNDHQDHESANIPDPQAMQARIICMEKIIFALQQVHLV